MIVCSCNALSHVDVEVAVHSGACRPADVYAAKRCRAQCGNCVPGMLCMVRSLLAQRASCIAAEQDKEAA